MDLLYLKALLMGIVEGLTEFLPISSTGHLILAGSLLNFTSEKAKVFEIVIQTGAMIAILVEYRTRLLNVLAGLTGDPSAASDKPPPRSLGPGPPAASSLTFWWPSFRPSSWGSPSAK